MLIKAFFLKFLNHSTMVFHNLLVYVYINIYSYILENKKDISVKITMHTQIYKKIFFENLLQTFVKCLLCSKFKKKITFTCDIK